MLGYIAQRVFNDEVLIGETADIKIIGRGKLKEEYGTLDPDQMKLIL